MPLSSPPESAQYRPRRGRRRWRLRRCGGWQGSRSAGERMRPQPSAVRWRTLWGAWPPYRMPAAGAPPCCPPASCSPPAPARPSTRCRTGHRNAHIRLLERRRIVDAIARHAHHVLALLQGRGWHGGRGARATRGQAGRAAHAAAGGHSQAAAAREATAPAAVRMASQLLPLSFCPCLQDLHNHELVLGEHLGEAVGLRRSSGGGVAVKSTAAASALGAPQSLPAARHGMSSRCVRKRKRPGSAR